MMIIDYHENTNVEYSFMIKRMGNKSVSYFSSYSSKEKRELPINLWLAHSKGWFSKNLFLQKQIGALAMTLGHLIIKILTFETKS